jgi:hypothetical protein
MSLHAAGWRLATMFSLSVFLDACSLMPVPPGLASSPAAPQAPPATARAATATAPRRGPHLVGTFRFEAERVAEGMGCYGPHGERPFANRRGAEDDLERYEVQCADRVVRVQCDLGICRPAP